MDVMADRARLGWRLALGAGGVLFLAGGSQHPSGPNDEGTRIELATMMEDGAWYASHALILIGAILIAGGLFVAWKRSVWRPHGSASRLAAVAWGLFAVESFFHLIAAVDADRLRAEDFAPIAYTHLGLAVVIYPLTGIAIIWLASRQFGLWPIAAKVFAGAAIFGGAAMALSTPLAAFTDVETDPFFALGGILPALWALTAAIVGERSATVDATDPAKVAVSA